MTTPDAPDPRKVAEAALDVFVYAPMGLALEAKELLPKLAERGRNQVVLARLGARFAMQRAEAEVDKLLDRLQPQPEPVVTPPAPPAAAEPTVAEPTVAEPTAAKTGPRKSPTAKATATKVPASAKVRTPKAAPRKSGAKSSASGPAKSSASGAAVPPVAKAADALAIPGYDTLSASQVVPRLDALRPAELEAIRVHEAAHRGRRTILSRVAQLQG